MHTAPRVVPTRRRALALLLALTAFVFSWALAAAPVARAGDGPLGAVTTYFVDVGQGDCEFVVLPDGQTMLIDGGDAAHGDAVVSFIATHFCATTSTILCSPIPMLTT